MNLKIRRALLSVSDKTGLDKLARFLTDEGIEIISTGGTAGALRDAGVSVTELSRYTGFPECLDGRVKTLHPIIHGGLLYLRDNPEHIAQAKQHSMAPIDLVVVNLYPFEATIAKPGATFAEAIDNIDIGGPSMLRSGAKNHQSVTVLSSPRQYEEIMKEMGAPPSTQGGGWLVQPTVSHRSTTWRLQTTSVLPSNDLRTPNAKRPPLARGCFFINTFLLILFVYYISGMNTPIRIVGIVVVSGVGILPKKKKRVVIPLNIRDLDGRKRGTIKTIGGLSER
jgi:hypothetical protein